MSVFILLIIMQTSIHYNLQPRSQAYITLKRHLESCSVSLLRILNIKL